MEILELGLSHDVAYVEGDFTTARREREHREREDRWVLVARGRSKVRPSGKVVTTSEDVPTDEG